MTMGATQAGEIVGVSEEEAKDSVVALEVESEGLKEAVFAVETEADLEEATEEAFVEETEAVSEVVLEEALALGIEAHSEAEVALEEEVQIEADLTRKGRSKTTTRTLMATLATNE
jgi:hypothetical protein